MTSENIAVQIRNSLQRSGIRADADALYDIIHLAIAENYKDEQPTLRDQFAMSVMTGLLAYSNVNPTSGNYHENCSAKCAAESAYEYADAMMKARKEKL